MSATNSNLGAGSPGTSWGASQDDGLNNGDNHGPQYKDTSIVLLAVATAAMFLRLYTRFFVVQNAGWDDYLACAGWVLTALLVTVIAIGMDRGIGKTALELTGDEVVTILKVTYWFVIIDTLALVALKISALCLYSRMTPSRRSLWVIRIVGIVTLMHGVAALIPSIFICKPISAFWDPLGYGVKCFHILEFDCFNTAFSVATEIVIDILPIPVIRKLQIPKRGKVSLYVLLAFSTIGLAAATLKLAALITWMKSSNINQNFALVPFTSAVEACVFLITMSIPAIHPLVRKAINPLRARFQSFSFTRLSSMFSSFPSSNRSGTKNSNTASLPRSTSVQDLRPDAHKHGYSIEIYAGSTAEKDTMHTSGERAFTPSSQNQSSTTSEFAAYPMTTLRPDSTYSSRFSQAITDVQDPSVKPDLFTHWEDSASIHY